MTLSSPFFPSRGVTDHGTERKSRHASQEAHVSAMLATYMVSFCLARVKFPVFPNSAEKRAGH